MIQAPSRIVPQRELASAGTCEERHDRSSKGVHRLFRWVVPPMPAGDFLLTRAGRCAGDRLRRPLRLRWGSGSRARPRAEPCALSCPRWGRRPSLGRGGLCRPVARFAAVRAARTPCRHARDDGGPGGGLSRLPRRAALAATVGAPLAAHARLVNPSLPKKRRAKADLPCKTCPVCRRPFSWRRKWMRDWDAVRYCSERCRRGGAKARDAAAP